MAMIKWEPIQDWARLRDKYDKYFEDMAPPSEKDSRRGDWTPSVDIHETETELIVSAELPGVEDKDIEITLEERRLILKGRRELEKETKKESFHRIEGHYGSFYRSFIIPESVDLEKIEAVRENGLLRITLPKIPGQTPTRIYIQPGGETKKKTAVKA